MGRLDGKVAVVTGGASGMGKATVELFLREGAQRGGRRISTKRTAALCSRSWRAEGWADRVDFVRVDVAEEDQVVAMLDRARERFGRLDVLFNNAGVGGAFGPITEISVEDWDFTQAVLLRSVFLGIKHGARMLIEQGQGGSIINTASIAGLRGGGGPQAYSAAKAGVINLTQTTAVELAQHHVRVNAICPGVIVTPLMDRGKPERAAAARGRAPTVARRGLGRGHRARRALPRGRRVALRHRPDADRRRRTDGGGPEALRTRSRHQRQQPVRRRQPRDHRRGGVASPARVSCRARSRPRWR